VKLSIAIACHPGLGGSGVIASELACALARRGHRVCVVATALPERLHVNGVRFERVDVPTSPVFEHAPYDLAIANTLVDVARRDAVDIIHVHYAIPHAVSAMLAAQVLAPRAPAVVVTLHGTDVTRLGMHPSIHAVTEHALAAADGITTPSRYLADAASALVPRERVEVISNFVDTERFVPRERSPRTEPVLFHVSNFRPIKRCGDLVDVLERVRTRVPARMILVGDGPELAAVKARARERGLADVMELRGRRDDFEADLANADAFVLPSEMESFGVAALEALAAGVPVFGYRVGGLPEVVVDGCGALVPVGDAAALADAVLAGLPHTRELGAAARAHALGFASDRVVERYEDYLRRICGEKRRSR
jgi:N-acetyl-alpha-D-glucosaminyl L-malate synthase BshA